MKGIFKSIHTLHYTEYLERSSRISGTILIVAGLYFLVAGLKKVISHLHMRKTQYTIVKGKILAWDRKTVHIKLSKKTEYYPTLDFTYEGRPYTVKSRNSFGEETMTAFTSASSEGRFEVRVPVNDPYSAVPNYELERNEKLYAGLCGAVFGLALAGIGVYFIATRPQI